MEDYGFSSVIFPVQQYPDGQLLAKSDKLRSWSSYTTDIHGNVWGSATRMTRRRPPVARRSPPMYNRRDEENVILVDNVTSSKATS